MAFPNTFYRFDTLLFYYFSCLNLEGEKYLNWVSESRVARPFTKPLRWKRGLRACYCLKRDTSLLLSSFTLLTRMATTVLNLYGFLKQHLYEILIAIFLLVILSKVVPGFLKRWKIYLVLKNFPSVPEQHFLFGHGPE